MALIRASHMSAADWLPQTREENYCNFSCVAMWFSSLVEVPLKHSSLCNEVVYPLYGTMQPLNNWDQYTTIPEGEVNSGGYVPRCEASRYISTALHLP